MSIYHFDPFDHFKFTFFNLFARLLTYDSFILSFLINIRLFVHSFIFAFFEKVPEHGANTNAK